MKESDKFFTNLELSDFMQNEDGDYECPNCKRTREADIDEDGYYEAYCFCGKASLTIRGYENTFMKYLDKLNIKWGYTNKLVWREWGSDNPYWNGQEAYAYCNDKFIKYEVIYQMIKSKLQIAYCNNDIIDKCKNREEALEACESDFRAKYGTVFK